MKYPLTIALCGLFLTSCGQEAIQTPSVPVVTPVKNEASTPQSTTQENQTGTVTNNAQKESRFSQNEIDSGTIYDGYLSNKIQAIDKDESLLLSDEEERNVENINEWQKTLQRIAGTEYFINKGIVYCLDHVILVEMHGVRSDKMR